jgi:hypothetical protein
VEKVRREICDFIEDSDILTFSKVAALVGISKQAMSKFKNTGAIGFRNLIRIAHVLFPKNPKEKISEWCLLLDATESIRHAFEYAAVTRNAELLEKMIHHYKNEPGVIKECVELYSIILKLIKQEIKGSELMNHTNKLTYPTEKTLRILRDIIVAYSYYYNNKFLLMLEAAKELEKQILNITDREYFIKECFLHRLCELYTPAYLHLNNLQLARHYGTILINSNFSYRTKYYGYYWVGMSYLLENDKKCLFFLEEGYDIIKKECPLYEKKAKYNLNFAKIFYGESPPENCESSLMAFYLAKKGERDLALKYIEKAEKEEGTSIFKTMYKGIALKSGEILLNVFNDFSDRFDFLFAGLVVKELKNIGYDTEIIESFLRFKTKKEEDIYFEKDFINCFSVPDVNNCG